MVSKASEDFPDPDRPVKTTSLSRGIDSVTFLRLCSRAPRIVIWSVGIRTFRYSFSLVTANVALAVATSRSSFPVTAHSATTVRRPAWMTWPVARRVSPTLAALMKLSFRSKLIARTTPGFSVRTERPMAESASVLIMPPCTNPEWLAMSSVVVISTIAAPSPVSTSCRPSHPHTLEGASSPPPLLPREVFDFARAPGLRGTSPRGGEETFSLTALPFGNRHAGRRRPSDQPAAFIQDVRLAEEQRLLHLDDAADRPQAPVDHRAQEVDLQLDGGVPHAVLLEGGQRHPHRRVRDLRDDSALHDAATVAVLRACLELEHDTARLGLGDARSEGLHPSRRLGRQDCLGPVRVLHGPRRDFLQFRTVVRCFGAAAIARATSASSSLPDSSPASRFRKAMMRDRKSTRLYSSHSSISYAVFCLKKKKKKSENFPSRREEKKKEKRN